MSPAKALAPAQIKAATPVFAALGDETRLRLVVRLCAEGPESIARLSEGTQLTRQAITKHLTVLARAGIVRDRRIGRERVWKLEGERIAEAREYLETGERLAIDNRAWMDVVGARSLLARIARHDDQLVVSERLARSAIDTAETQGLRGSATGGFAILEHGATLVRVGRYLEGHALLAEGLVPLRALGEPLAVVEGLLPLAEALRQLGRRREARRALEEADALLASMVDPGYLRVVRAAMEPATGGREAPVNRELSARELEVLRLMATGRSKREVAKELVVSYNTIHSHYRSIYRKLEVGSKEAAIDRAQATGLVDDDVASSFWPDESPG